jgi:hypothetical protein
LQAALTLAEAGWPVSVHERTGTFGGQLATSSLLAAKPQFGRLLDWYLDQLRRLGVELHPESEVDAASLAGSAAGVVDATGGTDYVPSVAGDGAHRVVGLRSWLASGIPDRPGAATVWGADRCGVYVADHLHGLGWNVTIIGAQTELAPDAGARERLPAVERLTNGDAHLHLGAIVETVGVDELVLSTDGRTRRVSSLGPVLVSLGAVPVGLSLPAPAPLMPVVTAGEAAGDGPLDAAVASGERAARRLVGRLSRIGAAAAC